MVSITSLQGQGPLGTDVDCGIRKLAFEYARKQQPNLTTTSLGNVFDSLELESRCNSTRPVGRAFDSFPQPSPPGLFVDYQHGADGNNGTKKYPLKTIARALELVSESAMRAIVLRAGIHFLSNTLQLSPAHSGLVMTAYCPGNALCEKVWLSGGVPITGIKWHPHDILGDHKNIWMTNVSVPAAQAGAQTAASLHWLEDAELETILTLARFPNAHPGSGTMDKPSLLDIMSNTDAMWERPQVIRAAQPKVATSPSASVPTSITPEFNHWMIGVGGECDRFDPPGGYLCANASGGGYGWDDVGPFFPEALSLHNATRLFPNIGRWNASDLSQATLTSWTNGW